MLTKEKVKELAKKIDDSFDWKKITGKLVGGILEIVDNWGLPQGLEYINEKHYDKIPVDYQDNIEKAIDAFLIDDYDGVLNALPETIDEMIDIKAFDDDFEATWIMINFQALIKYVRYIAEKKKIK